MNSVTNFRFRSILATLAFLLCTLPSIATAQSVHGQLKAKTVELNKVTNDLAEHEMIYNSTQIEIKNSQSKLSSLEGKRSSAFDKLKDLRNTQEKFPDIDFSDAINKQSTTWRNANQSYLKEKNYSDSLQTTLFDKKSKFNLLKRKQQILQRSVNNLSDQITSVAVDTELKKIKRPQRIHVDVKESCSLSMTNIACRDKAKLKAERLAIEKGSIVVIDTVTEIENFNLTKDEVRSSVSAQLSNIEITKDSFDLNDEKSGWLIEYSINATVTPVITDKMMTQLKAQARRDIGSSLSAVGATSMSTHTPVSTPSSNSPVPAVKSREEADLERIEKESRELAEKRAREADSKRQAELELEKIRNRSDRAAEEEARRQEEAEIKKSKRLKRRNFGVW